MIGNNYLNDLFNYLDEDLALNQLLEMLKFHEEDFIKSLYTPNDLKLCAQEEIDFLTKVAALIDYHLQINGLEVPLWIRDERLEFDKPYYQPKRISDFDKLKLQFSAPAPFRVRNAYFDLEGLTRV